MSGEPRTIRAADIFESTGRLRHRNRRDPSADGLPGISMGGCQGLQHVWFTRDDAPAMADAGRDGATSG